MNRLRVLGQSGKAIALQMLKSPVSLQQNSVRTAYVYTPDWLPGERPKTEEDRLKAAKRYNMLPEEYQVQPDNGLATGDYPDLPTSHFDERDPFYPWDYPITRTNYGEVLPDDFAITQAVHYYGPDAVDVRISPLKQFLFMVSFLGSVSFVLYFFMIKYRYYYPKYDAPMYKPGVVHYGYHKK